MSLPPYRIVVSMRTTLIKVKSHISPTKIVVSFWLWGKIATFSLKKTFICNGNVTLCFGSKNRVLQSRVVTLVAHKRFSCYLEKLSKCVQPRINIGEKTWMSSLNSFGQLTMLVFWLFIFRIPTNKKTWNEELAESLVGIQQQLNITITHYRQQMFDDVYAQASTICTLLNLLFAYSSSDIELRNFVMSKIRSTHNEVTISIFKLSPCFECRMLSSGLFPGVCSLNAYVSERSLRSETLAFNP
jgi:hypothetical protein